MQSLQSPHLFLRESRVLLKRVANRSTVCTPVKDSPMTLHRNCTLRAHSQTQRTHSVPKSRQKGLALPFLLGKSHTAQYKSHLVPPASVPRLWVFIDWNSTSLFPGNGSFLFKRSHLAFLWLFYSPPRAERWGQLLPAVSSEQWLCPSVTGPAAARAGRSLSWSSVICLSTTGSPPFWSSSLCFRWLSLFSFLGLWCANYFWEL